MSDKGGPGLPPPPPPPPPPGGPHQRMPGANNGMAIAALCCGIGGFLFIIPAILGIVFGVLAKNQIRDSNGMQRGDGMATADIVLGIVWIALTVILLATGGLDVDF